MAVALEARGLESVTRLRGPERARCVELLRAELVRRQARWRREEQEARCPSGWAAADELLEGGFSRGLVTAVAGAPGAGATTLVAGAVARATQAGALCAWVDTGATLDAPGLSALGVVLDRLLRVRAPPDQAEWAARLLVRSGAFALVAADWPAGPTPEPTLHRLAEAARTGRAALVLLGAGAAALPVAVRVRLEAHVVSPQPADATDLFGEPAVLARRRIGPPPGRRPWAGPRRLVRLVRERSRGGREASAVVSLGAPEPPAVPVRPPKLEPRRPSAESQPVGGALQVLPFTDRLHSRPARHRDPVERPRSGGGP